MPFGDRKKYFKGFFSSVFDNLKKHLPSGSLNFNNLGIAKAKNCVF